MTLVVVLLFGLGSVLVISAIATDPATGHSVSVLQTISNVWNDRVDFSQPGRTVPSDLQAVYVSPSPSTSTLAGTSYSQASVGNYVRSRQLR